MALKLRTTETERERELETALRLRENEIAVLTAEKAALEEEMQASAKSLRADPLLASFPVLDLCVRRPRKSLLELPVEQVSNTLMQLSMACKTITQQNRLDKAEINRLRSQLRQREKMTVQWADKTKQLADQSGIDLQFLSDKLQRWIAKERSLAEQVSLEDLRAGEKRVRKEIKMAELLFTRKGNAIEKLARQVEARRAIIDEIDELYNGIRVTDRDLRTEEENINELTRCLQEKENALESPVRIVINNETAQLVEERCEAINTEREPQERILKAHDYRLTQLENRLRMVDRALDNSHLTRDVEQILSETWSANSIDVPEQKEELYDIERIIPAQEKVHPGIYNLFLTEKEKMTRTVSVLNISTKEKEEVLESLNCEAEALAADCNNTLQELDELASGVAFAEEQQRNQALSWVRLQRSHYQNLCTERQKLYAEYLHYKTTAK